MEDDDRVLLGVNSRLDDVQIDTLHQLAKQLSLLKELVSGWKDIKMKLIGTQD